MQNLHGFCFDVCSTHCIMWSPHCGVNLEALGLNWFFVLALFLKINFIGLIYFKLQTGTRLLVFFQGSSRFLQQLPPDLIGQN